ncbi:unnamed protein product [Cylindrotheca closterium]|uniref:RelA/SpoT domain-containing protein n=1 Tax=Cylindrotheca closterium TaxID=2856 RepID=A0AAD2CN71_9STRA|nr:unnamed protein product [Cylindrotheca closterium]
MVMPSICERINVDINDPTFWPNDDDYDLTSDGGRAQNEWDKFKKVDSLLQTVNAYMDIYRKLLKSEGNRLRIIGSFPDPATKPPPPRHEIPKESKSNWAHLSTDDRMKVVLEAGNETSKELQKLGDELSTDLQGIKFKNGPLKEKDRATEKVKDDYDGDVLRVIDLARCSIFLESNSFEQANAVVDRLKSDIGLAKEWEIVRIKDGFEKAENYILGGYRDIKLNIRYKTNGHIAELQLHLKEYYDIKENGGHDDYKFARQQHISGITRATQLLDGNLLWPVIKLAWKELGTEQVAEKRARIARHLGDLTMMKGFVCADFFGKHSHLKGHIRKQVLEFYYASLQEIPAPDCNESPGLTALRIELLVWFVHGQHIQGDPIIDQVKADYPYPFHNIEAYASEQLGPLHPVTLHVMSTMNSIKNSYSLQKDIVNDLKTILGKKHNDTVQAMVKLGQIAYIGTSDEEKTESVEIMLDCLPALIETYGLQHDLIKMLAYQFGVLIVASPWLEVVQSDTIKDALRELIPDDPSKLNHRLKFVHLYIYGSWHQHMNLCVDVARTLVRPQIQEEVDFGIAAARGIVYYMKHNVWKPNGGAVSRVVTHIKPGTFDEIDEIVQMFREEGMIG